jgi:hypothetical protein
MIVSKLSVPCQDEAPVRLPLSDAAVFNYYKHIDFR